MILFDWLSFTTTKVKAEEIADIFDLGHVEWVTSHKKAHDYPVKYYFDGINIHFGNERHEDMVWVEMSGKGCRAFDKHSTSNWKELLSKVLKIAHNITRLDVAFDDKTGLLDIITIFHETYKRNWVGRFDSFSSLMTDKGVTVEIGSPSSDIMFRIYDKAAEQAHKSDDKVQKEELLSQHWVRFEMQFRDGRAKNFIQKFMTHSVGELFGGVLNNYLRFVAPSKSETNKSRWQSRKWWTKFVNTTEKIELWSKGDENYSLEKCENYVYKQGGNAISTLITVKGIEQFQKDLIQKKSPKVNEKYQSLISEYGEFAEKPKSEPPQAVTKSVYMYRCDSCGLYKSEDEFGVHTRSQGAGTCRDCMAVGYSPPPLISEPVTVSPHEQPPLKYNFGLPPTLDRQAGFDKRAEEQLAYNPSYDNWYERELKKRKEHKKRQERKRNVHDS